MPSFKVAKSYDRRKALFKVRQIVNRWFPPTPAERIYDVIDVVETALRTILPGFRVRVDIERIDKGEGGQRGQ